MPTECTYEFVTDASEQAPSLSEPWSCPHDAHEGSEYCPFHMAPPAREEAGIDAADLTAQFLENVQQEGEATKQFVGAHFPSIAIEHLVVDAPDKYPVDLRHATVDGVVQLEEFDVRHPVDFRHATVGGLAWDDVNFDEECNLAGLTCGTVDVTDGTFVEQFTATGATVTERIALREGRFQSDACFEDVTVEGPAHFDGAEFLGGTNLADHDADFEGAVVEGDLSFRKVVAGDTSFVGATVGGPAHFDDADFTGDATFVGATFEDVTSFSGTDFYGDADVLADDADFSGATFEARADFHLATISQATFDGATFEADVDFSETTIEGEATLSAITIAGELDLSDAVFAGDVTFADSEFEERVSAMESRFRGDARFEDATFEADVSMPGVEFEGEANVSDDDVTFEGVTFEGTADFTHGEFGYVDFAGCTFQTARFGDATFTDGTDFTASRFAGPVDFEDATMERAADFSGAVFDDTVDFTATRFEAAVTLTDVHFEGRARFQDAHFEGRTHTGVIDFEGATFERSADFDGAVFPQAVFDGVDFAGAASFESSTFEQTATFEGATFGAEASVFDASFEDDATFAETTFDGDVTFFGVEFHGGSDESPDADFGGVTVRGELDFESVEAGVVRFSGATVEGGATLADATFETVAFENARVGGAVDVSFASVQQHATFDGTTFTGSFTGDEARFDGDVSFAGVDFERGVSFEGAEFRGGAHTVADADFGGATFGAPSTFDEAKFRSASFADATFEDTLTVESATFDRDAEFSGAHFGAEVSFDACRLLNDAYFESVTFQQDASFVGVEFGAISNMQKDDASFEAATFHSRADFTDASFEYAQFTATTFAGQARFTDAEFDREATFRPTPVEDETVVDLRESRIEGGELGQPADGEVFYDLTGGEVGAVTFDATHTDAPLFNYFRICRTDFADFDFTSHKAALAENGWRLHEWDASERAVTDGGRELDNPATLENTYLKAKNGAREFGDRKAASEFFVREMQYRGQKNLAISRGQSVSTGATTPAMSRSTALGKWVGNRILYYTCGYGERLWRIIYVSAVAIVLWAAVYTVLPSPSDGSGITGSIDSVGHFFSADGATVVLKNLYFSTATFITLEYANTPANDAAKWVASLEAYFGALLIALVVFVLGRRVAL